jgi:PAS domain S-box-containing protein
MFMAGRSQMAATSDPASAETARLAALDAYHVMDTAPEAVFDDIVAIASQICDVPIALISLVDSKRQWFKAALGVSVAETPREIAFCAHAIEQGSTFVVEDAARDPRFAANPLVTGDPNLRFYAGTQLRTPGGEAIGTLCVLDTRPRTLTAQQHQALQALGRQVMVQLEFRKALIKQSEDEQYTRLILDSAIDYAIISLDLRGRVKSWNEGAHRILGWTSDDMLGHHCTRFFTPEDRAANVAEIEMGRALKSGHGSDERWHLRQNGRRFFASGEMMVLTDRSNQPVGFLKILRDRTVERRIAETQPALLELTDRLRDLSDLVDMSHAAAQAMGRTLDASRAGSCLVNLRDDSVNILRDWTDDAVASIEGEHRLRHFGPYIDELMRGECVVCNDVASDARAESAVLEALQIRAQINVPVVELGRVIAIFFVHSTVPREWQTDEVDFVREVAHRTQQAMERRRAEQQLGLLAASLHEQVEYRTRERDRLWSLSSDPFLIAETDGRWLRINPAWNKLLGWTEQEMLGRTSEWMEHPEDREATRQEIQRINSTGAGSTRFENRFLARDGSYHWFAWTAVQDDGLLYCIARDVTDEKSRALAMKDAEERLRQSHKMDAIGQLTGGIAHDFNNLLAAIIGSLSLAKRRLDAGRVDDIDRLIDAATRSAKSAAGLTERLLAFSRRQSLDAKPHDINQLVLRMEDLLQRTLGAHIQLKSVLRAGVSPAMTDANQLENAILNLAINARDAMPDGGSLSIETGNITYDEQDAARYAEVTAGDYIAISVSDTGSGMPPEVIAKAFDPFFTTKPLGQGTGLGLSMIYGFVKQSAGHVRIQSQPGQGTTVTLYLPKAAIAEAVQPVVDATKLAQGRGEMVLVVEDEETIRGLIVDVLKELGYGYRETGDPRKALALLDSSLPVDLLLTDVGLPHLNGRQLAEMAKARRPDLKVLFLTGYAEKAAVRSGFLGPGMDILTKPFELDALANKLRSILRN